MDDGNINRITTQLSFGLRFDDIGHNTLFNQFISADNLFLAWCKFRRGKRSKPDVMAFEHRLEDNLYNLQESFRDKTYSHDPYKSFDICDPKQRKIHKATVKDRVVHQSIVNILESLFDDKFIFDSYSCRVNKGTHAAVKRLQKFLYKASINNTRTVYALKCDIKKFFDSIDHGILKSLIKRQLKDVALLSVIDEIINSFWVANNKGLPLGNLTSQLFANIYMNELDRFVKFKLKRRFYMRYCDDFIIISDNNLELQLMIPRIQSYLIECLNLQLHPHKIVICSWSQGIDFLGYVLLPHCTVLRTKTCKRMLSRVNRKNSPSYLGWCKHASAYNTELEIQNKLAII